VDVAVDTRKWGASGDNNIVMVGDVPETLMFLNHLNAQKLKRTLTRSLYCKHALRRWHMHREHK